MSELPRMLTVDQLAAALGRDRKWIYRAAERHGAPAYHVGRSVYCDPEEWRAWLDSHRTNGTGHESGPGD